MRQQTRMARNGTTTLAVAAMSAAFALVIGVALGAAAAPADETGATGVACATFRTTAPYGAGGYNHVVTITNGCTRSVTCTVTTDVNPDPIATGKLAPGASTDLTTFRNSPAYAFKATVQCRYAE